MHLPRWESTITSNQKVNWTSNTSTMMLLISNQSGWSTEWSTIWVQIMSRFPTSWKIWFKSKRSKRRLLIRQLKFLWPKSSSENFTAPEWRRSQWSMLIWHHFCALIKDIGITWCLKSLRDVSLTLIKANSSSLLAWRKWKLKDKRKQRRKMASTKMLKTKPQNTSTTMKKTKAKKVIFY